MVFKKGDIVGGRFNPQDAVELILDFDRSAAHAVFDTGAFDTGRQLVAS